MSQNTKQNDAAQALHRTMLEAFAFGSAADQRAEAVQKASREEIAQIKAQGGTYYHDASAVDETRARREAQEAAQREANATGINVQTGHFGGEWVAPHRVVEVSPEEKLRLQSSILNTSKGGGAAASINVGKHGAIQTSVGATGGTQWLDFDE